MPAAYVNFLTTSTQASAALIGLLFVSVSIAPDRVFGAGARAEHQLLALSAFSALASAFFLSFAGLLPGVHIGDVAIAVGTLALTETLALLLVVPQWRREKRLVRGLLAFVVSAVLYGYEIVVGIRLIDAPDDRGALGTLLVLLIAAFAVGLIRAWQLLGATHHGFAGQLLRRLRNLEPAEAASPEAARPGSAAHR